MPAHGDRRILPYQAQQMYDLVADVERYPEFLPWCSAARVRSRAPQGDGREVMLADLVIAFSVFRERFGSRVLLDAAAGRIETEYLDGPFRHLGSLWVFRDLEGQGCAVEFHVDFEFRNLIFRKLAGVVFNEAMHSIVRAFEVRAHALYG